MKIRREKLCMINTAVVRLCLAALVIAAFLSFFVDQNALADTSAEWRHLAVEANRAQRNSKPGVAIKLWMQALPFAQKLGVSHPWYSITLRNLILLRFDNHDDLEGVLKLVHMDLDSIAPLGPKYPDRTFDLLFLGKIGAIQGHWAESRKNFEEALSMGDEGGISKDEEQELLVWVQVPYAALHCEKEASQARRKLIDLFIHRHPGKFWISEVEMTQAPLLLRQSVLWAALPHRRPFYEAEADLWTEILGAKIRQPLEDKFRIEALRYRAESYYEQADLLPAAQDYLAAAQILSKYPDRDKALQRCSMLNWAASYLNSCGHYTEALSAIEEGIKSREKIGTKTAEERRTLLNDKISMANWCLNLHKAQQSIAVFSELLGQPLDAQMRGQIIANICNIYDVIGDRQSFLQYVNKARSHTATMRDSRYVIETWAWLADRYALLGESQHSDECMAQALKIADRLYAHKPSDYAKVRVRFGELWLDRRRPDLAEKLAQQALEACQGKPYFYLWEPRGRALNLLARSQQEQRHYAEAIKAWQELLVFVNQDPEQYLDQVCTIPTYLTSLYVIVGNYAAADQFAKRARDACDIYTIKWNRNCRVVSQVIDAMVASKEGKFEQSNALCRQVISAQNDLGQKLNCHYYLTHNLIEQRKYADAAKQAQDALDWRDAQPQPYVHSVSANSFRAVIQIFTGIRARAIDLSGDHKLAQQIFAQLTNDDFDMEFGAEPVFANAWCWKAENLRTLGLMEDAQEARRLAHRFYQARGMNPYDLRDKCDKSIDAPAGR